MKFIEEYLQKVPKTWTLLDAGSGEGVLVEKLLNQGYDIIGLDLDYSSRFVLRGDITKMPFADKAFDLILCLDVIEHLDYEDQERAIIELRRV